MVPGCCASLVWSYLQRVVSLQLVAGIAVVDMRAWGAHLGVQLRTCKPLEHRFNESQGARHVHPCWPLHPINHEFHVVPHTCMRMRSIALCCPLNQLCSMICIFN